MCWGICDEKSLVGEVKAEARDSCNCCDNCSSSCFVGCFPWKRRSIVTDAKVVDVSKLVFSEEPVSSGAGRHKSRSHSKLSRASQR